MHGPLEDSHAGEPFLPGRVLYGTLDLVGGYWAYAHQRVLEVGAHLKKNLKVEYGRPRLGGDHGYP